MLLGNLRWIVATALLGLAALGSGLGWLRSEWTAAAELRAAEKACHARLDARDVEWTHRIAEANAETESRAARDATDAVRAADQARTAALARHADDPERAAALERWLASQTEDPVAWPADLARELNR